MYTSQVNVASRLGLLSRCCRLCQHLASLGSLPGSQHVLGPVLAGHCADAIKLGRHLTSLGPLGF